MKQTDLLASRIYREQAQGEDMKQIKSGAKTGPLLWGQPTLMPQECIFLCLLNKILSFNRAVTLTAVSNLCCGETEPRKLRGSPDIHLMPHNHQSTVVSMSLNFFSDSIYKWDHMVFVFLWLASVSIHSQSSSMDFFVLFHDQPIFHSGTPFHLFMSSSISLLLSYILSV